MTTDLTEHVITATRRWLERAVIGLNLCPFAKAVHVKQQIRYSVSFAATPEGLLADLEREMALLATVDPARIDTTLVIVPGMFDEFLDFHFFLTEADALLKRMELSGVLQIASFHPQFEFAGNTPDDIANHTNRSPFPTLHLLREASIDRAVAAFPDASIIYERNIETLERLGTEGWNELWK